MEKLFIAPTSYTPKVEFDHVTGILEMSGTATPEDSHNFFQPILAWFEQYKVAPAARTTLVFKMEYFNTSSTVFMLRLMKGVGQLGGDGKEIVIQWYHHKDDEDFIEAGQDFGALAKTHIELIPY